MAGKPKQFTVESRDKVATILTALPEKPKAERGLAAKEVVASLKADIRAAQAKGYTIEEIVKLFKDGGVDIGLTTLKAALKQPKKKTATAVEDGKKQSVYTPPSEAGNPGAGQVGGQRSPAPEARRVLTREDKQALRNDAENALTPAAQKRGDR